ncbi:AAA family ATPase [uncultured Thomasclavelia sp.]|uniref:AAA family ATPase n=1 Tax=uncultured Thomasclavelia sp. TaxID=3025759 RepID=UPI0025FE4143|nr:AAA family ATPase [uncultured Thomasclavelia sp.]
MLPKTLVMSAFGPYHQMVKINFESFYDNGLFLITGPTGAGKTMIFDAIMFALYGVSSGSERSSEQFRSDQAAVDTPTFVELEFVLHHQIYYVKRNPRYMLPGRKTPKQPSALLKLPDGKLIEGVKEVNAKIKNLLGIDDKQFKQIVMIAQGEFTKLIYATSDDRERVLRNLFKTDQLEYLQEKLKEKVKDYKTKYDLLFKQRDLFYQNLHLDDQSADLNEYLKQASKQLDKTCKTNETLQQQLNEINQKYNFHVLINERFEQLTSLKVKQKQYQEQQQYYLQLKKQIDDLKKAQLLKNDYIQTTNSLQKTKQLQIQLEQTSQKLDENKSKLVIQEQEYQKIPEYRNQLSNKQIELKQQLETKTLFIDYQNDLKQQTKLEKLCQDLTNQNTKLENKLQKYQKVIEKDSKNISRLDSLKTKYELANQEYEKMHRKKLEIHALNSEYDNYVLADYNCCELREKYEEVEKTYQNEKKKYDDIERRYRLSQAGILASQLQDNQPCPVCGALHHPAPAKYEEGALIDHEDLKQAKQVFERFRKQHDEVFNDLMLKQQETELLKKHLDEDAMRLGIEDELGKEVFIRVLGSINQNEKQLLEDGKKINEEIIYLKKLQKSIVKYQEDVTLLQQNILKNQNQLNEYSAKVNQIIGRNVKNEYLQRYSLEKIENQIDLLNQEISKINKFIDKTNRQYLETKEIVLQLDLQYQNIEKQLGEEKKKYQEYLNEYTKKLQQYFLQEKDFLEIIDLISQLETKEKQYQDYLVTTKSLNTQIEHLENELKEKKMVDLKGYQDKINELNLQVEQSTKTLNEQKANFYHLKNTIENILTIDQQLAKNHEEYQCYLDLSEIASGKNEYRISFERYVLAAYFENILYYANVLLKRMSQGRYQLYRRDNRSKGAGKQGLELDILDMESGMLRDVKTLSGGESFKAALSLALGLSKMIQDHAGGIELNTLFIDEGFGSLDSQSLDQAINCLVDLQQEGKLIGIISHVTELKERIDQKIVLTRLNKETKITIE